MLFSITQGAAFVAALRRDPSKLSDSSRSSHAQRFSSSTGQEPSCRRFRSTRLYGLRAINPCSWPPSDLRLLPRSKPRVRTPTARS